ncbi:hypothetical protein VNI00_010154 [Paramarasmius palmivorus]|uniref:Uncharacterized protein n=1 Tax=Paramarasmius palmivorus TaxID=297713 RepID=A0AAW0CMI0_9AGAR
MAYIRDELALLSAIIVDSDAKVRSNNTISSPLDILVLYLNVMIGDCVVVWRACTICGNRKVLLVLLTLFIDLVQAANITFLGCQLANGLYEVNQRCGQIPLVSYISTGVTNIAATGALGYKAWVNRKGIKEYLTEGYNIRNEKVLFFIVETGVLYSVLWSLGMVDFLFPDQQYRSLVETIITDIMFAAGAQLVCAKDKS